MSSNTLLCSMRALLSRPLINQAQNHPLCQGEYHSRGYLTDEYGVLTISRKTLIVVHSEKVNPMWAHERKRSRVLFLVLYLHFFLTTIGRSTIDDDQSGSNASLWLSKREAKERSNKAEE